MPISGSATPADYTSSEAPLGTLIPITETSQPGQVIDTPSTAAGVGQRSPLGIKIVTLKAVNIDTADHTLHVQWGGDTNGDMISVNVVHGAGFVLVIDEDSIAESATIKAWADAASYINIKFEKRPKLT